MRLENSLRCSPCGTAYPDPAVALLGGEPIEYPCFNLEGFASCQRQQKKVTNCQTLIG